MLFALFHGELGKGRCCKVKEHYATIQNLKMKVEKDVNKDPSIPFHPKNI
jgi:hypothetical protein